jgi:SAM-dependent methyltransferase
MTVNGFNPTGALVQAAQPWEDAELASLYDAFPFDGDIALYRRLAETEGGKVLEVGCGTGRVLLPLVQAGGDVTGIDVSPHMLAFTRAKLDAMGEQAELVQADMRGFQLNSRDFDVAIIAVKSFAYLLEREDQLACLEGVRAHLRPGGVLVIDLLHPTPAWIAEPLGQLRHDLIATNARGETVSRVESVLSVDLARQVRIIRSVYEVIDARGMVSYKRFVEWPYRWTHRFEAELLLERAGFSVEALYGGYANEPFTSDSAAMVFVTRS